MLDLYSNYREYLLADANKRDNFEMFECDGGSFCKGLFADNRINPALSVHQYRYGGVIFRKRYLIAL